MTNYHWPAALRAAVTPGCTIVVRGFVSHTVTVDSVNNFGIAFLLGGVLCEAPWSKCDPSTLSGNVEKRQLDIFGKGGDK